MGTLTSTQCYNMPFVRKEEIKKLDSEKPHKSKAYIDHVSKQISTDDSGEKENDLSIKFLTPTSSKSKSIIDKRLVDHSEVEVSETDKMVEQPIKVNQTNHAKSKREGTINNIQNYFLTANEDNAVEDQPKLTSSEESLPDLDMDTNAVAVVNEDLVNRINKISSIIVQNLNPGISVAEVSTYLSIEDEKTLRKPEAQVALFNAAKRIHDEPRFIESVIVKEISENNQTTETFGTRALILANVTNQDVSLFFEPKDFDCSKLRTTLCEILNSAHDVEIKKPQYRMKRQKSGKEKYFGAIKSLVDESKAGKSVTEIISGKQPKEIESLQCIECQMGMLCIVENLGHGKVTEDVVLEQLSSDRVGMLNIVGTKALTSVVKEKPYSSEDILENFNPDDFESENVKKKITKILNVVNAVNQKVEKDARM